MSKLIRPGQIIFALGIMSLGILQFFAKDFIIARPPAAAWAVAIPGKLAWAYASGIILTLSALGIIFKIKARTAALLIAVIILLFSFFFRHLYEFSNWVGSYKALALTGGAFIVAVSFTSIKEETGPLNFFSTRSLMLMGCLFISLFLISAGLAHFKFDDFVISLVPAYMKTLYFWTYFAAVALLLGGIGLIFNATRKYAALLAGMMILIWFFMVHIPRAIETPNVTTPNYEEWMGVCESFAFSGIFFVLAGMSSKKIEKKIERETI